MKDDETAKGFEKAHGAIIRIIKAGMINTYELRALKGASDILVLIAAGMKKRSP